jgi:hypothetical protein
MTSTGRLTARSRGHGARFSAWAFASGSLIAAAMAPSDPARTVLAQEPSTPSEVDAAPLATATPSATTAELPPAGITLPGPATSAADPSEAATLLRLREGTRFVDRLGVFRQVGESLVFVDEEGREIGGLPNLNLERVMRALKSAEEPDAIRWSVSGTITEFSGRNYLLISRAVFKAASLPPAPDLLEQ